MRLRIEVDGAANYDELEARAREVARQFFGVDVILHDGDAEIDETTTTRDASGREVALERTFRGAFWAEA